MSPLTMAARAVRVVAAAMTSGVAAVTLAAAGSAVVAAAMTSGVVTVALATAAVAAPEAGTGVASGAAAKPAAAARPEAFHEVVEDFSRYAAPPAPPASIPATTPPVLSHPARSPAILLERITTAVPWPRGLAWVRGDLVVLARGRHRSAGGVDPSIPDDAGCLFRVDPSIAEPVVSEQPAGEAVKHNARLLARPTSPPFHLLDASRDDPRDDDGMDRPYCTLVWDPGSGNFFLCGYSGVDLPGRDFLKNATDSILRFDTRVRQWFVVESHDPSTVPAASRGRVVPDTAYPHHDPGFHPPPHGWINGPDGCTVAGRYLYAAGKDNHVLVQYDLDAIRRDPAAPPPESRVVLGDRAVVRFSDGTRRIPILGHSAAAARDGWLYVGFRTTSIVLRFPLDSSGDLVRPVLGELIAVFEPWDPERKRSADLMDLAFDSEGALYVSCAREGRVWRVGVPDPSRVFSGNDQGARPPTAPPYLDLRAQTPNPKAKTGNILFDPLDRLYVCSGNYDSGTDLAGVVYRATRRHDDTHPGG